METPGGRLRRQNRACLACYRMENLRLGILGKRCMIVALPYSPGGLVRVCGLQTGECIPRLARMPGAWCGMLPVITRTSSTTSRWVTTTNRKGRARLRGPPEIIWTKLISPNTELYNLRSSKNWTTKVPDIHDRGWREPSWNLFISF